jgi:hypothetical protein
MRTLFLTIFLLILIITPFQRVSSHVLITDETNSKGAILHIIPDDDPVAGQVATLFFDAQDQFLANEDTVNLTITDEAGNVAVVPTEINESLVTADFTFPDLGVYQIKFELNSNGETFIFTQSQRISRGINNSLDNTQKYAWAEMMLVGSGITFVLLIIVGFNNRKDIIKYSKIG